ncbi:MAG: J domain-containing protein [Candidatus Zixiibacteriota bacterium]
MATHYETLRVPPTASRREIRSAYRQLMKGYHPDVHRGDPSYVRKAQEVNAAYDILKDPARRRKYDSSLAPRRFREEQRHSAANPATKEDILEKAVVEGRRVAVSYVNLSGIRTRRTIRPFVLFRGRQGELYVRAFCELREEERTFRVSRMSEISLKE